MTNSKHIVIDARIRRTSTGRYTDRLIEHLQNTQSPHRFTVLIQPDDPWTPRAANFETQTCSLPQFSFNPLHEFKFVSQLRALKPDLVHFTMTQQPLTYRGKTITTTHDLTMLRFVRAGKTPLPIFWLKKLGYRLIFLVVHTKTERVLVPTNFVAEDLAEHYPMTSGKIDVTYEANELPITEAATPLKGIGKPFIMHLGCPFPHKNIKHLILAYEELLKTKPELHLVLAGKQEYYFKELEAWASQRPSYPSIHFTGFIPDSELKWLYENAEAYVMPSLSEGFSLPGLEAMTYGCPLISSDATCMPEIYSDAAYYFNARDLEDTVSAITTVLDDAKLRKQLIAEGYKQIKKFSWQKMADQTLISYDKALNLE